MFGIKSLLKEKSEQKLLVLDTRILQSAIN